MRYYFDVTTGPSLARDTQGVELGSREAACSAVSAAMPEYTKCSNPTGEARMVLVVVRNEDGKAVRATSMSLMAS